MKLPRDIDHETRDLLNRIFTVDANLRITISEIMGTPFFKDVNWEELRAHEIDEDKIPYVPEADRYFDLLKKTEEYYEVSNQSATLHTEHEQSPVMPKTARVPLGDFTLVKVNKAFENF